jgi:hypothetical protein
MSRVLAAVLVGAATVGAGGASASQGDHPYGKLDWAKGAGTGQFLVVMGDTHFVFNVTGGRPRTSPAGQVAAQGDPDDAGPAAPFTVRGNVTCLRVDGNRASFKWRFVQASGSAEPFEGGGLQAFVEDNGEPHGGQPVDRVAMDPPQPKDIFGADAARCDDPDLLAARYRRIDTGNLRVHDAASD